MKKKKEIIKEKPYKKKLIKIFRMMQVILKSNMQIFLMINYNLYA